MKRFFCAVLAACVVGMFAPTFQLRAALPAQWDARGIGGGGGLYAPAFNPADSAELYLPCDMSPMFHTANSGATWDVVDFRQLETYTDLGVQFTADPRIRWALDRRLVPPADSLQQLPVVSTNGGATWLPLATNVWPVSRLTQCLFASPADSQTVLAATANNLYCTTNGGATMALVFTNAGNRLAGAFFDPPNIFVGCRAGLLVSTNGGASFALANVGGFDTNTEAMYSFCGAKSGGTTRFCCVTGSRAGISPGMTPDALTPVGVYRLDYGQPDWTADTSGLTANDLPMYAGMALNDVNTAWLAVRRANTTFPDVESVYRKTNAAAAWQRVFFILPSNTNLATGWIGAGGTAPLSFSSPRGFAVAPYDASRACLVDSATSQLTTNGGATWTQLYINSADQNPPNTTPPFGKSYRSVGLEPTVSLWLHWTSPSNLIAGHSDIRATRSADGGNSWAFDYSGMPWDELYHISAHPQSNILYAANPHLFTPFFDFHGDDASIDPQTGALLFSTNGGANWATLKSFGGVPTVWTAIDPNNPNVMFASTVNSTSGGIWATTNLLAGTSASWFKLASHPRMAGHPYNLRVLNDGSLVCSHALHMPNTTTFQTNSGIYYCTNPLAGASATWLDRSTNAMWYWTFDVTIDPGDAGQNTWFAGVYSGYGSYNTNAAPDPKTCGGLYRTTDRGVTWARIFTNDSVHSCTVNPANPSEMYVSTRAAGLWFCNDLHGAGGPTFQAVTNYPFRNPLRTFFNPYDATEIWIASYGNGWRVGRAMAQAAQINSGSFLNNGALRVDFTGTAGTIYAIEATTNLQSWNTLGTASSTTPSYQFDDTGAANTPMRFYRVRWP